MAAVLSKLLQAPGLLIPKRKPIEPVKLDPNNPFFAPGAFALPLQPHSGTKTTNGKYFPLEGSATRFRAGSLYFNQTNDNYIDLASIDTIANSETFAMVIVFSDEKTSGTNTLFRWWGSTANRFEFLHINTTYMSLVHKSNGTVLTLNGPSGSFPKTGDPRTRVAVICVNNADVQWWEAGELLASGSNGGGKIDNGDLSSGWHIGNDDNGDEPWNGCIKLFAYTPKALSRAACIKLSRDPYSLLTPHFELLGVNSVAAGQNIPLGQATETDAALSITPVKTIDVALGQSQETDSALSITPSQDLIVALNQAQEIDSSLALMPVKDIEVALDQAQESDSALAIIPQKAIVVALGQAQETDAGLSITPVKDILITLGQAQETDNALDISPPGISNVALGQSQETDSALGIVPVKDIPVALGQAQETDAALIIDPSKHVSLGQAAEIDSALAFSVIHDKVVELGLAIETDAALSIVYESPDIAATLQGCPSTTLVSEIRTTELVSGLRSTIWECDL